MSLPLYNACPLVRVQTQIDQDRPVDLLSGTKPAVGLVGEAVLVVIDPHRTERGFGQVEDLVALRWAFAG